MIHKIITTLIATLLITSIVGPVAGLAAAQGGAPAGMVGTPSENVGPPDHARGGGQGGPPDHVELPSDVPTHAAAWSVHSSKHAGDLETTVGAIDGQLALVFTDDVNHDGRTVAVDATTLADAVGERPERATVRHSSGREYEIAVEYERGHALLELEEFSSNTVTFGGTISISGDPATDGAQYQYNLSDVDAVDNYTIDVTGREAAAWANVSGVSSPGSVESMPVGGTTDPAGPSGNGRPVVSVSVGPEGGNYPSATDYGEAWYPGNGDNLEFGINVSDDSVETVDEITIESVETTGDGISESVDVYLSTGQPDGSVSGDLVNSSWTIGSFSGGTTIELDSSWSVPSSADVVTVEFDASGSSGDSDSVSFDTDGSGGYSGMFWKAGDLKDRGVPATIGPSPLESLDVSADDGTSVSFSSIARGGSETKEFPVSTGATELSMSGTAGTFEYAVEKKEVSETVDPTIEVNGATTSYTGTLAAGESASLSTDKSWIREGSNRVNVSMSTPSSGPDPQVGLEYSHAAADDKSVEYSGETWSERYNVSHTYASDRTGAELTIPFASSRVVAIRSIEKRVDGGSWATVSESERSLAGSELTVELGDVSAGQQVDVRAAASKVRVRNGEISVTEPTMLGEPLNTKISLDSMGDDFEIEVNNTGRSGELHYTHSESWSNPQAFARYEPGGTEALRFPNAEQSDVARISTIDMGVNPSGGTADVRVLDPGEEPEVQLRESTSADRVEFVWRETTSGHQYQLYSLDAELERDTATASSPVALISPGVPESLKIYDLGSASGGGDNTGVVGPTASRSFGANAAFIIGAAVAGLIVLFGVTRRWGDGAVSSGALFGTGAVVIVLVVLQLLAPNVLADYLGRAIESAFPLVLLAGAAIAIIWLRQRGDDTSIIIQGDRK